MFNLNSLKSIVFGRKTVDGVLGKFNKTLNELSDVESHNSNEANRHAEEIRQREIDRAAATVEAQRASTVKSKINALLSTDN